MGLFHYVKIESGEEAMGDRPEGMDEVQFQTKTFTDGYGMLGDAMGKMTVTAGGDLLSTSGELLDYTGEVDVIADTSPGHPLEDKEYRLIFIEGCLQYITENLEVRTKQ